MISSHMATFPVATRAQAQFQSPEWWKKLSVGFVWDRALIGTTAESCCRDTGIQAWGSALLMIRRMLSLLLHALGACLPILSPLKVPDELGQPMTQISSTT